MPTFEEMKNAYSPTVIGEQLKEMSNFVMDETFSNSTSYRKGMIYDCNLKEIQEIDFRFIKTKTYTMEKDQVEYMIMFRPGVNPEIDFDESEDKKHRLGYYIDIKDENSKKFEKWLMVGKDTAEFDKYNVLKCNWLFEWLDAERKYRSFLGCVRDRNSYNSGIWSDGFTTSVENQTAFIVPTNAITKTIDYGMRFMITDNEKYPKTYEVTKIMDTFPLGNTKVTLSQSHYNEHTDLCAKITDENIILNDNKVHMICDYYKSSLPPITEEKVPSSWKLLEVNPKLYVKGQPQIIKAVPDIETNTTCEWHIFVDGEEYTDKLDELESYLDIKFDDNDNNSLTIAAINKVLAKYIIKIAVFDANKTYYDSVEMEVTI